MLVVPEGLRHVVSHELGARNVDDHATGVPLLEIVVFESLFET
jgi:hypothetical protein